MRRALLAVFTLVATTASAQVTSVTDSPDPVRVGGIITYKLNIAIAGPFGVTLDSTFRARNNLPPVRFVDATGLTCRYIEEPFSFYLWAAKLTCSVNPNTTNPFYIRVRVDRMTSPERPIEASIAGHLVRTMVDVSTAAEVTASDSPDPVAPDGNITYTVEVTRRVDAPADAPSLTLVARALSGQTIVSATQPPGRAVCNTTSFFSSAADCVVGNLAPGEKATYVFVYKAARVALGVRDQTLSARFSVNHDFVAGEGVTVTTAYDAPTSDLSITNVDSPDPMSHGGTTTYTQTLTNAGPDAAPDVRVAQTIDGSARFRSVSAPAGFTCTTPAVGATGTIVCTTPSLASGATAPFQVVVEAVNFIPFSNTVTATILSGNDPNAANNTATATTSVISNADVAITKTGTLAVAIAGQDVIYTIAVRNHGPDASPGIVMTDALPASLWFRSLTAPSGYTCSTPAIGSSGTVQCTLPLLASGTISTFTLVARIATVALGTISNTATVTSASVDGNPANGTATATVAVTPTSADISVTKTASAVKLYPSLPFVYTIVVRNDGPDAARNFVLTDVLPSVLKWAAIADPSLAGCTRAQATATAGPTLTCLLPTLASGSTATFIAHVEVTPAPPVDIDVTNTAVVAADTPDPDGADRHGSSTLRLVRAVAELGVTMSAPSTALWDVPQEFTFVVTNAGPDPAVHTSVSFGLYVEPPLPFSFTAPPGFICSRTGPLWINCSMTLMEPATSATFRATTFRPGAFGYTSLFPVRVQTVSFDPISANNAVTASVAVATRSADLSLTMTTDATTIWMGSLVTYRLVARNAGPDYAANVFLDDSLPGGLAFVSATASRGTCTSSDGFAVRCSLLRLDPGDEVTVSLTVRGAKGAPGPTITNVALIGAAESDANRANNVAGSPTLTIVPASANLFLTKTTNSAAAITGGTILYTLTVSNGGPAGATNVVVTDALPPSLTLVSAVPSQGTCGGTTTVTCSLGSLGTLASNGIATIELTTRVVGTSGTIVNSATATAVEADPTPATATAPTVVIGLAAAFSIPTASTWALLVLGALLAAFALRRMI